MTTQAAARRPGLYLIVCGAPPARDLPDFIPAAQLSGWDICVIATPSARSFFDVSRVEAVTARPVLSDYMLPGSLDLLPPARALLLAPATFNTLNKLAAGITDTLALGLLAEAVGGGLPIVAVPWVHAGLSAHPAYPHTLQRLRAWGVTIVHRDDSPRGDRAFPWRSALQTVNGYFPDT